MPKEASQAHSLNEDDLEKMVSDAVFYCLIADQKKAAIKVRSHEIDISGELIDFFPLEK